MLYALLPVTFVFCYVCVVIGVKKLKRKKRVTPFYLRETKHIRRCFFNICIRTSWRNSEPRYATVQTRQPVSIAVRPTHFRYYFFLFQRKFILSPVLRQPVSRPVIERTKFSDDYHHSPPLPGNAVHGQADSVRKSFVSHIVGGIPCTVDSLVRRSEHSGGDDGTLKRVSAVYRKSFCIIPFRGKNKLQQQ